MQKMTGSLIAPQAIEETTLQLESWSAGIDSEIEFWDHWLNTGGFEWPEDFKNRLSPDTA